MKHAIEKRQNKFKEQLLEQFKKTPIVQISCERVGIGRASYYRWRKEDSEFSIASDKSLHDGRLFINDMAESQLISEIKNRNMTAIIFWLKHNHPSFSTRVEIVSDKNKNYELSVEQRIILEKAIKLASFSPHITSKKTKNEDENKSNTK
ncbi:MAG: hypothetical protein ABH812_04090 [bacterium]